MDGLHLGPLFEANRRGRKVESATQGYIMKFCTACGKENRDTSRFCAKCGKSLLAPPPVETSRPAPNDDTIPPATESLPVEDEVGFRCPNCDQHLKAPSDMAGVQIECPACGVSVNIPHPAQPATSAPVASTPIQPPRRNSKRILILSTVAMLMVAATASILYFQKAGSADRIEDYRPCSPLLNFTLEEVECQGTEGGGWQIRKFGKLFVNNKEIPVSSTSVAEGGFFVTEDFGRIRIQVGSVGPGGTELHASMTARQEKLLGEFVGIKGLGEPASGTGTGSGGEP